MCHVEFKNRLNNKNILEITIAGVRYWSVRPTDCESVRMRGDSWHARLFAAGADAEEDALICATINSSSSSVHTNARLCCTVGGVLICAGFLQVRDTWGGVFLGGREGGKGVLVRGEGSEKDEKDPVWTSSVQCECAPLLLLMRNERAERPDLKFFISNANQMLTFYTMHSY